MDSQGAPQIRKLGKDYYVKAEDAIEIDNSNMNIDEQFKKIIKLVEAATL